MKENKFKRWHSSLFHIIIMLSCSVIIAIIAIISFNLILVILLSPAAPIAPSLAVINAASSSYLIRKTIQACFPCNTSQENPGYQWILTPVNTIYNKYNDNKRQGRD